MILPIDKLKSSKGQVLVLYLLVIVIGLAVVLSVSSRVVTDIRVSTTTDESNRAYFAAEAGIEEALARLQNQPGLSSGSLNSFKLNFSNLNNSSAQTFLTSVNNGDLFVYPKVLEKDEVGQVAMLNDFTAPASGSSAPTDIYIWWGDTNIGPHALEVSVIYCTSIGICGRLGPNLLSTFRLTKYILNSNSSGSYATPNSCAGVPQSPPQPLTDPVSNKSFQFYYRAKLNLRATNCGLLPGIPGDGTPAMIRVRPLFGSSPFAVQRVSGSANFPRQGTVIESVGTTESGVTRRLVGVKLFPALPALYDYVLFSGRGNIQK